MGKLCLMMITFLKKTFLTAIGFGLPRFLCCRGSGFLVNGDRSLSWDTK